jgi:transposase
MLIKTILNSIEKHKSFIYGHSDIEHKAGEASLIVELSARKNSKAVCITCQKPCPSYDKQPCRDYQYVPLWNIPVYLRYAPRRVNCQQHGIHVEQVPWSSGKQTMTHSYRLFLATWAKRLSWREVSTVFRTSWDSVHRAVAWVVDYGLAHRSWDNVEQIGVDEIAVFKGHRYLTCVYQLDKGMRRLLWCGKDRTVKTLLRFFREFGKERAAKLRFVCSDMWAPYLKVIKKKCVNALNILDRFHIAKKFNEAVDEVRRQEVKQLKAEGNNVLDKGRWLLLKNKTNLNEKQTSKLSQLLKINLQSIKAYLMKEDFKRFWLYHYKAWADKFLQDWCTRTLQANVEPMKKVARMLRKHKPLILNWFSAKGSLSSGPVEGLNNKAKLTIKKAYGFKTLNCLQIALYHQLGRLNEPPCTHRFC